MTSLASNASCLAQPVVVLFAGGLRLEATGPATYAEDRREPGSPTGILGGCV